VQPAGLHRTGSPARTSWTPAPAGDATTRCTSRRWWRWASPSGGAIAQVRIRAQRGGMCVLPLWVRLMSTARGCAGVRRLNEQPVLAWHAVECMIRVLGSSDVAVDMLPACLRGNVSTQAPTRTAARRRRTSIDTSRQSADCFAWMALESRGKPSRPGTDPPISLDRSYSRHSDRKASPVTVMIRIQVRVTIQHADKERAHSHSHPVCHLTASRCIEHPACCQPAVASPRQAWPGMCALILC